MSTAPEQMTRPGLTLYAAIVLAALLSAGALVASLPGANAQAGIYTVTGTVTDTDDQALAGADVLLSPNNEDGPTREATTDEEGSFTFEQVENGRYQIVANHACCKPADETVEVQGTQLEERVDLTLEPDDDPTEDNILLQGRTIGHDDEDPIPDVRLTFQIHYDEPTHDDARRHGEATTTVTSSANGTYVIELRPGHVRLSAEADAYDETTASFTIEEDRTLDIPMRPASEQAAIIQGTVRSDDGEPLRGAHVSISPNHEHRCGPEACTAALPATREDSAQRDDVTFWFRSAASPYDDARTDEEGRYRLSTHDGPVRLTAWSQDHARTQRTFNATAGEAREENITLERIPPDNVHVEGRIVDQATGEAIPYVHVRLENQRWGHYNGTVTGENGSFEMRTKPGYTILHARADDRIPIPCEAEPVPQERSASPSQSTPARPPCSMEEREHAYLPRALTFQSEEGASHRFDFELIRKPAPDARLQGWAVNASSQEGIPNAHVTFTNELTNEHGRATTDEDGSFRADVRFGYYTIRAWADGHFQAVENVEIAPNQTRTVAIELVPGQARHGYHVAYAEASHAPDARSHDDAGHDANVQEATSAAPMEPALGPVAFEAASGGLGPYDPSRVDEVSQSSLATPSTGMAAALVVASLAALARRSRASNGS